MPLKQGNRLGVMVYLTPETYEAMEKVRGKSLSASALCAMVLEEILVPEARENCSNCSEC